MREVKIQVYKFDELSPAAKETAIQNERETIQIHDQEHISSCVNDRFKERLEELGLPTEDIRWRLSYSQGDGVAFYGSVDPAMFIEKNNLGDKFPVLAKHLENADPILKINKRPEFNHYDHWNTMVIEEDIESDGPVADINIKREWSLFLGHVIDAMRETSKKLDDEGYKMIVDMTSDEWITQTLQDRDDDYTPDGVRFEE